MSEPRLHQAHIETVGRTIDDSAVALLRIIHEDIQALHIRQHQTSVELAEHIHREEMQFSEIMRAFPDGTERHRAAHEAMIKAAQAQEQFWRDLRIDIAKKGVWGLMVILCGLVIAGAAAKFGIVAK